MARNDPVPNVEGVREILKALDAFAPFVQRRANLTDRIEKMKADQRQFAEEVESLASALEMQISPEPLELANSITTAVNDAKAAKALRDVALERLKDANTRKQGIAKQKGLIIAKGRK